MDAREFDPYDFDAAAHAYKDRLAAYDQYANSYVRKPVDYDQFVIAARQLGLYWMMLNVPPPQKEA